MKIRPGKPRPITERTLERRAETARLRKLGIEIGTPNKSKSTSRVTKTKLEMTQVQESSARRHRENMLVEGNKKFMEAIRSLGINPADNELNIKKAWEAYLGMRANRFDVNLINEYRRNTIMWVQRINPKISELQFVDALIKFGLPDIDL